MVPKASRCWHFSSVNGSLWGTTEGMEGEIWGGGNHFWSRIAAFGSELITAQIKRFCGRSTPLSLKSPPRSPYRTELFFPPRHLPPNHHRCHHLPPLPFLIWRWQAARLHTAAANWVNNKLRLRRLRGERARRCSSFKTWIIRRNKRVIYHMSFVLIAAPSLLLCVGGHTLDWKSAL